MHLIGWVNAESEPVYSVECRNSGILNAESQYTHMALLAAGGLYARMWALQAAGQDEAEIGLDQEPGLQEPGVREAADSALNARPSIPA